MAKFTPDQVMEMQKKGFRPLFEGDISRLPSGQLRPVEQIKYIGPQGEILQYRPSSPFSIGFQGWSPASGYFEQVSGPPISGGDATSVAEKIASRQYELTSQGELKPTGFDPNRGPVIDIGKGPVQLPKGQYDFSKPFPVIQNLASAFSPSVISPPKLETLISSVSKPTEPMPLYTPSTGIGTKVGNWVFTGKGDYGWEWKKTAEPRAVEKDMSAFQKKMQETIQSAKVDLSKTSEVMLATQSVKSASDLSSSLNNLKDIFDKWELSNPSNKTNLAEEFNNLLQSQGIPGMQAKLIDFERVMEGTEDDIRREIQNAGGFATESQIKALVTERNKVILREYNVILGKYKIAQDYVDQVMKLKENEKKYALDEFDRKFDLAKTALNYELQMIKMDADKKDKTNSDFKSLMTTLINSNAWDDLPKMRKDFIWYMAGYPGEAPEKLNKKDYITTYDASGNLLQINQVTGETKVLTKSSKSVKEEEEVAYLRDLIKRNPNWGWSKIKAEAMSRTELSVGQIETELRNAGIIKGRVVNLEDNQIEEMAKILVDNYGKDEAKLKADQGIFNIKQLGSEPIELSEKQKLLLKSKIEAITPKKGLFGLGFFGL